MQDLGVNPGKASLLRVCVKTDAVNGFECGGQPGNYAGLKTPAASGGLQSRDDNVSHLRLGAQTSSERFGIVLILILTQSMSTTVESKREFLRPGQCALRSTRGQRLSRFYSIRLLGSFNYS